MKNNRFLRYLFLTLSLAVMVVIFVLSSQDGNQSSSTSGSFSKWLAEVLQPILPTEGITAIISVIRKLAHVSIYALLGIFVTLCVFTFDFGHGWHYFVIPIIVCLLYACSDEMHQLFVDGRDGKVLDVFIDGIGFALSTLVCNLVRIIVDKVKARKQSNG